MASQLDVQMAALAALQDGLDAGQFVNANRGAIRNSADVIQQLYVLERWASVVYRNVNSGSLDPDEAMQIIAFIDNMIVTACRVATGALRAGPVDKWWIQLYRSIIDWWTQQNYNPVNMPVNPFKGTPVPGADPTQEPYPLPASSSGGGGGGGTSGGKKPHHTSNDPPVSPTGHPNPPTAVPPTHGNAGKVVGDVIVRPNQKTSDGGDIDWWLGIGDGTGEGAGVASEISKWLDRGGGPARPSQGGPGQAGPSGPPSGQGHEPSPQPGGYSTANNGDPGQADGGYRGGSVGWGQQGESTPSPTSNDKPDQDGTPTTEDSLPDQGSTTGSDTSSGSYSGGDYLPQDLVTPPTGTVGDTAGGGNGVPMGSVDQGGSTEFPDPSGTYSTGNMPDPDSSDGGGEGPSFTPGFHFTPHGGNTGRPIEQPPDPVDSSWTGFQQSSNPIVAMLGGAGGGGDDWGGNNPRFDPAELADPETSGSYRRGHDYKPDPESTGPSNPHAKAGKGAFVSRSLIGTRLSRFGAAPRNIRIG